MIKETNDIRSYDITDWETLKKHENDQSLKAGDNIRVHFQLNTHPNAKYRYFRVVQTAQNFYKSKSMIKAEENWALERLLWIAFKKEDPLSCLLGRLPKDIINVIIGFLGRKKAKNSWSHVLCVCGFELYGKLFLPSPSISNNISGDAAMNDVPMPNAINNGGSQNQK